jgi:hypothetical protein
MSNIPAAEPPVQEVPHTCAYVMLNDAVCGKSADFRLNPNKDVWLCPTHYTVLIDVLSLKTLRSWFEE